MGPTIVLVSRANKSTDRWFAGRLGEACRLKDENQGSVAVIFGLAATVLVAMAGGAIDYARLVNQRGSLQSAVDAGVMAGGNALKLVVSNTASVTGLTKQTIETEAKASPAAPVSIQVKVAPDKTSVWARAERTVTMIFGPFIGIRTIPISAQATASVVGRMRLCMLALDSAAPGAFALQREGKVTARGCALYSNSSSEAGMVGLDHAQARAETICSAGGYQNDRANFVPNPQTGCPVIKDPLRDRPAPPIGPCRQQSGTVTQPKHHAAQFSFPAILSSPITLEPGTYCGGLYVTGNATVTLSPGIYVFKNGPLIVNMQATLKGTDVGLYFTGDNGGPLFDRGTTISLAAPTSGTMAGILMSEAPDVERPVDPVLNIPKNDRQELTLTPPAMGTTKPMRIYRIISDNARTMLGTIHLPSGRLVIDAMRPVADSSAYTVVVAQQINLYKGPNLYLNTQYTGSNVPVPKGVGPLSGRILLTQ